MQSVVSPPFLILLKILASHPKCLQEQEERQQRCQAWKLPEDQELMFPFTEAYNLLHAIVPKSQTTSILAEQALSAHRRSDDGEWTSGWKRQR